MARSQNVTAVIAVLLAAGIIATILAVLLSSGGNQEQDSQTSNDENQAMNGDYVYAEVLGQGKIKGIVSPEKTALFLGIPFSQPPVGDYRWQKPRPAVPFEHDGEYYDATYHRSGCYQNCFLPSPQYSCPNETDLSEDCLHLAVYVPSGLTRKINTETGSYYKLIDNINNANLPVMFFLHGGAFFNGGSMVTLYDGRFISEKGDVIVVVTNYRLGVFGFLYQDTGNSDSSLGNFGIWDQVEALTWVKKHIRDFGGDPYQVTLFGQSAGAQSIAVHLANDYSKPLFHQAVMQSNPFGISYKTKQEAESLGKSFAESARCGQGDMTCLRALSQEEVLTAQKSIPIEDLININSLTQLFEPWAPVIDDELLYEHPWRTFSKGENQEKPIMNGIVADEAMFFVIQIFTEPSQNPQAYELLATLLFADETEKVLEKYPHQCIAEATPPGCDDRYPMNDFVTDYLFSCPTRNVFMQPPRFGDGNLKLWSYVMKQVWSFPSFWEEYDMCYNLTCHGGELPYLFNMVSLAPGLSFTPEESAFAERLIVYWTNFAKYGDPNGNGDLQKSAQTYWPRMYEDLKSGENYKTMKLSATGEDILIDFSKENCDMFDQIDLYLNDSIKLPISNFENLVTVVKQQNLRTK